MQWPPSMPLPAACARFLNTCGHRLPHLARPVRHQSCLPLPLPSQEYNMRKKLEHGFKAVVQDGRAISGGC